MILSAAIVSEKGEVFCSNQLPYGLKVDITKHANDFLYALSIQDDQVELPYIETTTLRYIYKQTGDLYWLLVTKLHSDMYVDINLLGRFICIIMEYGATETNSMTLTDEQRGLFYRHIWRPWDEGATCLFCGLKYDSVDRWEQEFEGRLQFLNDIRDGRLDDNDVSYFNGMINECWASSAKLTPKWNSKNKRDDFTTDSDSFCSNESRDSISEEALIDNCRLKCRVEDLRLELVRLQDPYLRLFVRRDLLNGSNFSHNHQTISAPPLKDLDVSQISKCESDF